MTHPNIALVRRGFEAFDNADVATMNELIDENVVWHSIPGTSAVSGDFKGRNDTMTMFMKMYELSGGQVKSEIEDIAANDDNVYVLVKNLATRDGHFRASSGVMRFRIEDGKAKEVWEYGEDPAGDDAFWS